MDGGQTTDQGRVQFHPNVEADEENKNIRLWLLMSFLVALLCCCVFLFKFIDLRGFTYFHE